MLDDNEYDLEIKLEEICRACLKQESNLKTMFFSDILNGQIVSFPKIFEAVTDIKIFKEDAVPNQICPTCKIKICDFFSFKETCSRSNDLIKLIVKKKSVLHKNIKCEFIENKEENLITTKIFEENTERITLNKPYSNCDNEASQVKFEFSNENIINLIEDETNTEYLDDDDNDEEEDNVEPKDYDHDRQDSNEANEYHQIIIDEFTVPENISNDELKCDICKIQFVEEYEYIEHIKIHDLTDENETKQLADSSEFKDDSEQTTDELLIIQFPVDYKFFCRFCKNNIKSRHNPDIKNSHMDFHRKILKLILETINVFQCGKCHFVFHDNLLFENHFIYQCKSIACSDADYNLTNRIHCLELEYFAQTFECDNKKIVLCNKTNASDMLECGNCNAFQSISLEAILNHTIRRHPDSSSEKRKLICSICKKWTWCLLESLIHMYMHSNIFKCPYSECLNTYSTYCKLNMHLEKSHLFMNTPECKHCAETFKTYEELLAHLKQDCQMRNFKCEFCEKRFLTSTSLKVHQRIHTKCLKFMCQFCGKKFVQSGDMKIHARTHTGEKPYKCPICPKRFRTTGNRQDHIETHNQENNFLCEICNKTFKGERILKAHLVLHTGEKNYECPVCKKTFYRKQHVKSHMRVHNKKKSIPPTIDWIDEDVLSNGGEQ